MSHILMVSRKVIPAKMIALFFALIAFQAVAFEVHAAPILDSSFGSGGVARIGVPSGTEDTPTASVLQRDGKLLIAGWTEGRSHIFVLRLNANGGPDTSFGNGGVAQFDLPNGNHWHSIGQIEQRPDGSILMCAKAYDGVMLTRLTADGEFDPTFAANGFFFTADSSSEFTDGSSARFVQQADGGILIVSDATQGTKFALRLTRLTAAGERDLAYAPNGEKTLGGLPPDFAMAPGNSVAAEPDGGLTVMAKNTLDGRRYLLVRVTAAGILDSSFGAGGLVSGYDLGNSLDNPFVMVRTADGKLLIIGDSGEWPTRKVALWRVTAGGLADASFGAGGRLEFGNGYTHCTDSCQVATLSDGSFVLIAFIDEIPGSYPTSVMRFDANGVPDTAFGAAGSTSITLPGYARFGAIGLAPNDAGGLLIISAARCNFGCFSIGMDIAVASLDSAGNLQPGYGRGDGFAIWGNSAYSHDQIDTILPEPSGKVVLAGTTNEGGSLDYLIARLTANGAPDTTFGTSGRVLPHQYAHFTGRVRAIEQENGAITVAAGTATGSYGSGATVTAFRLGSTGVLDAGFAPGFTSPMSYNATVALRVRPDGRLLYGTATAISMEGKLTAVLEQHLPDGSLDTSFGSNGKRIFSIPNSGSRCSDMQVLADGSVVFAVLTLTGDLHVFKLDAQGTPVTSFGENGQFTYKESVANFMSEKFTLLSLADGTLLAAIPYTIGPIYSPHPTVSLLVVRISANGVLTSADKLWPENAYFYWALAALPDASVLVTRIGRSLALYRLYPDNSLDESFGLGGAYPLQGMSWVDALAIDADGRVLIAGQDSTSDILVRYRMDWPASGATAAEYYKADIDHYFMTAHSGEAIFLDNKPDWGWARTGKIFNIWLTQASAPGSASPVCRFFGTFANGAVGSHFYTVDPVECEYVKGRLDWGWSYEGDAFYAVKPTDGACPDGTSPIYRVYNNGMGGAPNHRYMTNLSDVNAMVSRGWGSEGVAICGAP